MKVDVIHKGYPLFGFDTKMHLHLLAVYVPKLYSKGYIKTWLQTNPEKTFLDMIHPSDIAFIVLLLKNSESLWISEYKNEDNTESKVMTRFNSGGGVMWSDEGMEYFNACKKNCEKTYVEKDRWDKLQADWCVYLQDHLKDKKCHFYTWQ